MPSVRIDPTALERTLAGTASGIAMLLERKAIEVEGTAKRLCPVDTGRLRSSITHEITMDGDRLIARVGSDVVYARAQELGYPPRNLPPHPYLRPALMSTPGLRYGPVE